MFQQRTKKGGMEPPELSVQPSMTKTCDIDIVVQGSSVQRETKDNRNVEQKSSCQHNQERINDKAVDEKEFLIWEEIKEKPDADNESSVEEIQNDIKDKGKNSEGVTNDMHIELKIFPCTASNKRKEIGSENTKERVLSITKTDSETAMRSGKMVDYTDTSEFEEDTSSSCQKIVDCDFTTDTPKVKDPLIGGNLPADAQPSDYEEQDDISISSKREKLEGKSAVKKKNEELFSSDDGTKSNSIVDDIIYNLDVKNVKDQLVSKSMEAFWLDNSEELLTDAIHKSAVVVSETGEESNKVPVAVESTSDTTLSTAQSDSDMEAELVIIQENKKK